VADKTPSQEVRDWREANIPNWRPLWEAMEQERRFLDGDRYQRNTDWHNRDRRRIQIRGREVDDNIRHTVAQMTAKPRNVEARPIDQDTDPDQAEVEVALVEQELSDPRKGFDVQLEATYVDVCSIGMGTLWTDWCPNEGPWGELYYSAEAPDRFMWSWDFADDPHHPLCRKLHRVHRCQVDYAREKYNAPWLEPDRQAKRAGQIINGVPLQDQAKHELSMLDADDDFVTLIEEWRKRDDTSKKNKETGQRMLKPEQRYMACENGRCGLRMPPQGEVQASGELQGEYPEEDTCPICGSPMSRIDMLGEEQPQLAYKNGKRLIIAAPFCANPEGDEPVWDGDWPIPRLRSFPLFYLSRYVVRGRPRGDSDTSWYWDQQLAADNLRTIALQQVMAHRTFKLVPDEGLKNAKGGRFEFRDDDFDSMFYDVQKPANVQFFNSSGVDPNYMLALQPIMESVSATAGKADLGSVEDQKGKSGVALQTAAAVGEIPNAHLNRRKNYALGRFYGIVSDAIHGTYPPQRVVRLNIDGLDIVSQAWGEDSPNMDYVVEDSPDFTGLEQGRSEAWDAGMAVVQQFMGHPNLPAIIDAWARFHQIPKSVSRDLQAAFAVLPPQLPTVPGAGGETNSAPGGGPEMTPQAAPGMNGAPDAGMVPAY